MSFFNQFPFTQLQVGNQPKAVIDLFRHVDVNDILASDIASYRLTTIGDGERPDNLSQRLYGTPDYYWTFFIINESLKNGLDDWPQATSSIETEFTNEYDNIGVFTLNPVIRDKIVVATGQLEEDNDPETKDYSHVSNSLAGLDLSYEDLKVYRNFSTASIAKWDQGLNQLYLKDFSNKNLFMGDPRLDLRDTLLQTTILSYTQNSLSTWAESSLQGTMSFTFNDWPIIGENSENGYREGDGGNHMEPGPFYKNTMTAERVEWCEHLFEWFETQIVDQPNQTTVDGEILAYNNLPLREFQDQATDVSIGRTQAALNVFRNYFTPWFVNGTMKWYGLQPYVRQADQREHSFFSARNAPAYYYRQGGEPYNLADKINGHDMLNGIQTNQYVNESGEYEYLTYGNELAVEGQEPMNYVSNYQAAIRRNDEKSQIKIVRPELIEDFVKEFKLKLNQGLTRVGSTGITSAAMGTGGTGGAGFGTGQASSTPSSGGGSVGGGGSSY